jgi:hypothetical protein
MTLNQFETLVNSLEVTSVYGEPLVREVFSLTQERVFSDKFSATSLAVVEEFLSVDEIAYMSIEELSAFVYGKSKGKFSMTEDIAKLIQKAVRSPCRLTKTVNDSVNQVLAILL